MNLIALLCSGSQAKKGMCLKADEQLEIIVSKINRKVMNNVIIECQSRHPYLAKKPSTSRDF